MEKTTDLSQVTKKESDIKIKIIGEEKINGIITRAEGKWQTEGKNSTHYLCNLELYGVTQYSMFMTNISIH
jgi:hypothetical protein